MKFGYCSWLLVGKPFPEIFQFLHNEGCDCASLLQNVMGIDKAEKKDAAALIREYGMTLCFHGNVQGNLTPDRKVDLNFLRRMYDEVAWWNEETGGLIYDCCSDSVYGSGDDGRPLIETSFDLFGYHADHFENTGIRYGIENTDRTGKPGETTFYNCGERFQESFSRFGARKGAAMLLDVGHAHVASRFQGIDLEAYLDSIPFEFCEVHVTDNFGKKDDHLKPGEGTLDFSALIRSLEKRGFDGPVNMEVCVDILNGRYAFDLSDKDQYEYVRSILAAGRKIFFGGK